MRHITITEMAKQDQNGPQISAWMGKKSSRTKQKKEKIPPPTAGYLR